MLEVLIGDKRRRPVRLLLDAHLSARRVATILRDQAHDVLAVDEQHELRGWADARLLELVAAEGRIAVTFNARHYVRIARAWADVGRAHAGLAIFVGIDHSEFGLILKRLAQTFATHPSHDDWVNAVRLIGRHP